MLNAFRHQRFLHSRRSIRTFTPPPLQCSTPFGINDSCTLPLRRVQRAKAEVVCSTPFGINDSCTRAGKHGHHDLWVLNAFRHQRFLHRSHITYQARTQNRCSTPFGINDSCTLKRNREVSEAGVLNAFRHQRFLHDRRAVARYGDERVLNAFRHQRFLHRWRAKARDLQLRVMCSTPFGINDSCTC